MPEQEVGVVVHYFNHISVAAIRITAGELAVGDTVHVKGHTSNFTCTIDSMQVEHQAVQRAKPGDNVGIKVPAHAHEHDKVYKVVP
jgi:putative protease